MSQPRLLTPRDWSVHPALRDEGYKSTASRGPTKPLIPIFHTLSELTGPAFGHEKLAAHDADLTLNGRSNGEPVGERIIMTGRVLDEQARALPNTLIEIWQANAAGRYVHRQEHHDAPLDANFFGAGRCVTDAEGRYRFVTIKPGAYPWRNHHNAWRPAHIHLSLFGPSLVTRLVTQMYFPGDPLLALDPIYNSMPDPHARKLLVARFSIAQTKPDWALAYEFDITLRGRNATPFEA